MKRESRRLERRWISSKLEIHKQLLKEHCKKYNLDAKETYHQKQFADRDSKHLLQKKLKNCVHRLHRNLFLLILLTMNLPIASLISSVTRSKGLNEILSTQMNSVSRFDSDKCDSSFSDFSLISEEIVHDINMKSPSSTCSLDPIPTWLLKNVSTNFCQ